MGRTKGRHHSEESHIAYKLREALDRLPEIWGPVLRGTRGRHHAGMSRAKAFYLLVAPTFCGLAVRW